MKELHLDYISSEDLSIISSNESKKYNYNINIEFRNLDCNSSEKYIWRKQENYYNK